mgnify:FL=1
MKNQDPLIFIGYDTREDVAYKVCRSTLLRKSPSLKPENVRPLKHQELRDSKLFYRGWRIDSLGQYWDEGDHRPFSTEFSFTRFLVPQLARNCGVTEGPVIFVDCDFLFLDDIKKIKFDKTKAVQVVKFEYNPKNTRKMDNKIQTTYSMKLWSSLMIFNMGHPDNQRLDTPMANTSSGRFLHGFGWLDSPENIGDIPPEWNFIPDFTKGVEPSAVHFTEGGPWFKAYKNCAYSTHWYDALNIAFNENDIKFLDIW